MVNHFYGLHNLEILRIGGLMVSNKTFGYLPMLRRLHLTQTEGIESSALHHMSQLVTGDHRNF